MARRTLPTCPTCGRDASPHDLVLCEDCGEELCLACRHALNGETLCYSCLCDAIEDTPDLPDTPPPNSRLYPQGA